MAGNKQSWADIAAHTISGTMPHYEEISVNHLEGTTRATFGGRSRSVKGNWSRQENLNFGLVKKEISIYFSITVLFYV